MAFTHIVLSIDMMNDAKMKDKREVYKFRWMVVCGMGGAGSKILLKNQKHYRVSQIR